MDTGLTITSAIQPNSSRLLSPADADLTLGSGRRISLSAHSLSDFSGIYRRNEAAHCDTRTS